MGTLGRLTPKSFGNASDSLLAQVRLAAVGELAGGVNISDVATSAAPGELS